MKLEAPGAKPQTLRGIAEFLGVDTTVLFQLAGYLTQEDLERPIGALGAYVGARVEALSPDQQTMILDVIGTLEKTSGLPSYGAAILAYLPAGKSLRQRHLTWAQAVDRRVARLLRLPSDELFLASIQRRLHVLMPGDTVRQEQMVRVAGHPVCMAVMSVLLPRTDIPTGLEKLYYLT
ncbi:MAG: hypothetical protein GY778_10565, partial [bacterium]|nr:hypothetical protein [bacterium]